ncbi:MAG: hypothetical protein U0M06_09535 [Clostridia bacterium]|nr:hypothetical protein [Clostridia bacterium]
MAKSIISEEKRCYICGSVRWIEIHHVFGGADRKTSEIYGLTVPLCHYCHNEPPNGVHFNKDYRRALQAKVQRKAMKHYGWDMEAWRSLFGRNYL